MRSHQYEIDRRDLAIACGLPLIPLAIFALIMHATAALDLLPKPRPTLDVDRTILIHQADASRAASNAEIVLLGDSSCLMDVSATQLTDSLGRPVLNLGTLSFLNLSDYASLLREFAAANPDQLKSVVLLMHPEALRGAIPPTYHAGFLRAYLRGEDFATKDSARDHVSQWLGMEIFRSRILARAVPVPLRGAYGKRFGFSDDLERDLSRSRGSAVELVRQAFAGNPEFRLGPHLERASREFRSHIASGVTLRVGITPLPESYAPSNYAGIHAAMLAQWADWLQADALKDLPATMPDHLFAKTTHLTEQGAQEFTSRLARSLEAGAY